MPEVADVFRRFAGRYLEAHGAAMLPSHRRAIADILACRTEALGGQLWSCDDCGTRLHVFHSCLMGKFRNGESGHDRLDTGRSRGGRLPITICR
jgi:hypothetical protein